MQIAIVKNNQIVQSGDTSVLFSDICFPETGLDSQWMIDNDVFIINHYKNHNTESEKLIPVDPYIEDGEVFSVKIESLTAEELNNRRIQLSNQIRNQRNSLLVQTDWTSLTDVVLSTDIKEKYSIYRQALRDITLQPEFPKNVVWPVLDSNVDLLSMSTIGSGDGI